MIKKFGRKINENTYQIFVILVGLLLIMAIINVVSLSMFGNILEGKVEEVKEVNRPAEIELVVIEGCISCFDISPIVESVKAGNVEILNEESLSMDSDKAKNLIAKYNIDKLPALLIFGEINKTKLKDFESVEEALIFNQVKPLYVDVATNELRGEVSVIELIDSSCEQCISLSPTLDALGQAGVIVTNQKKVEYNSAEGSELINKFEVKQIPAFLISEDIDYYGEMKESLSQLNLTENQGFYAIHSIIPPYRDLITDKIVGLVDLIMLVDNSCSECYDVENNKQILQRFGMTINSEDTYDISSSDGIALISKYSIEKVPIIILSPEADAYDSFVRSWSSVGDVEDDGWFVMRGPENLGVSKDIINNKIVGE